MSTQRRLIDDCFLHDKDRLRHDDVLALLNERLGAVAGIETVGLGAAQGRVLAAPVLAARDIPDFSNAAVDGYAFAAASLGDGETVLEVTQRIQAGVHDGALLAAGQAARIFTGAVIPPGADTCIMQEDALASGDTVTVPAGVKPGINVRAAGEDVRAGDVLVAPGVRLRPQELAAIASSGLDRVSVFASLRVAVFSTGDEVIRPGVPLHEGQVYDANHYLLRGLLQSSGAVMTDLGILSDTAASVRRAIGEAAGAHDVIITTGGASRGEADHVVETIQALGSLHAWQLAIKPGRPLAFGQIGDTVFLGLPGNPVAAFVCYLLYVQPVLARLQGADWAPPQRYRVPAGFAIGRKKPDRREFLRGWVENTDTGPVLRKFARDGSGLISGLTQARGLIEIPEEVTSLAVGGAVNFIPFTEFGL